MAAERCANCRTLQLVSLLFVILVSMVLAGGEPLSAAQSELPLMQAPVNQSFSQPVNSSPTRLQAANPESFATGYLPSVHDPAPLRLKPTRAGKAVLTALPATYDSRTLNHLTPVRDQGNCGSCWAFAAVGSVETSLMPSESRDFSEQNLKNLAGFDWGPCDGGNADMAAAYFSRWGGPVNESADPYNPSISNSAANLPVQKHVQEILYLPNREGSSDNDIVKQAVMAYGGVFTSMYYDSSKYNSLNKSYYSTNGGQNHAVMVVGWDDNFSSSKFSVAPPGNGAFIVRNSWGSSWGEKGYFYISYYDASICNFSNVVFNQVDPTDDLAKIYQYDPLGWITNMGYGLETAWFANIFTASGNDSINAVSFYTASPNSTYEVYIYTGVSSGPRTGTLAASGSGSFLYSGYHTVNLSAPAMVTNGSRFSVVVKLTCPGYDYPIPIEMPLSGYSSNVNAGNGQSYVSSSGSSWSDLNSEYSGCNVCLKAFAAGVPAAPAGDLIVQSLSSQAQAFNGGSIEVTDSIQNNSTSSVGGSKVKYYLSANQSLEITSQSALQVVPADFYLGERFVPALAAQEISTVTSSFLVPDSTPPGLYYVLALADADNQVNEVDEGNNLGCSPSPVNVLLAERDLWLSGLSGPLQASVGTTISVQASVGNTGNAESGQFYGRFYLSTDNIITAGDTFLGSGQFASIAPGNISSTGFNLYLPDTITNGSYFLGVILDPDNLITETDETNNCGAAPEQTTVSAPFKDLLITALSGPTSAATGSSISIANTVKNQGTAAATGFYVKFYLSLDDAITTADTYLGQRYVSSLAAGASSAANTSLTVPSSVTGNTYFLGAIADANAQVAESDETNNQLIADNPMGLFVKSNWSIPNFRQPLQELAEEGIVLFENNQILQGR